MKRLWPLGTRNRILVVVGAAAVLALVLVAARVGRRSTATAAITTEAVERRDIAVTVEATGTVEPINLVEVKSKASGQITKMPVEVGTVVKPRDLLAQIDPRDVRNAFDQARAAVVAAETRAKVTRDQRRRSEELFREQVITANERETALLDDANAQSALVAARTNLDLARQRLEDATVRAPVAGVVLEKPVSVGQVISSATSSVSGGTTLLKMADLSRIRMRALVVETDIGKVREGQPVTVVVDAFPQRGFSGVVEKVEPQAQVQQSVTMFPVLISISNEAGLLLPGMNGEVTMLVDRRSNALAVPVDAIRSFREISVFAADLGLNLDSLRARMRQGGGGWQQGGRDSTGFGGRPDSPRARARRLGRDSTAAGRGRWRGAGASRGASQGTAGGASFGGVRGGDVAAAGFAGTASSTRSSSRVQVAIVKTDRGLEPRVVRIGLSNYDYAEVLGGLQEGDQVVMLGVIEMQGQRQEMVNRVRQRVGGGITGGTGGSGGSSGSGSGGSGSGGSGSGGQRTRGGG